MTRSHPSRWAAMLVSGALALGMLAGASPAAAEPTDEPAAASETRTIGGRISLPDGADPALLEGIRVQAFAEGSEDPVAEAVPVVSERSLAEARERAVEGAGSTEAEQPGVSDVLGQPGDYSVTALAPGRYRVQVVLEGEAAVRIAGQFFGGAATLADAEAVDVVESDRLDADIALRGAEPVGVEASAPQESGEAGVPDAESVPDAPPAEFSDAQTEEAGPAAAVAAERTISGKVTLPAGSPTSWFTEGYIYVQADSDGEWFYADISASGNYTITGVTPGSYRVSFSATGAAEELVSQYWKNTTVYDDATFVDVTSGNATGINATLSKGATISGKVTLPAGSPTSWFTDGAISVSAYDPDGNGSSSWANVAADGKYTLKGLAPGSYQVSFDANDAADGLVTQYWKNVTDRNEATRVKVTTNAVTGIDAALKRGLSINGTVKLAAGLSAPWLGCVEVSASNSSAGIFRSGIADAATGKYSITGLPAGSYDVSFSGVSWPDEQCEGAEALIKQYYPGAYSYNDATMIELTDTDRTGINATMNKGYSIRGKITLPQGAPPAWLQSVYVNVEDPATGVYSGGQIDANGNYTVSALPAGDYRIGFNVYDDAQTGVNLLNQYYGGATNYDDATRVKVQGDLTGLNVTMKLGQTISGKVTLPTGADPSWLASVQVSASSGAPNYDSGSAKLKADGSYSILGLLPGEYTVTFGPSYDSTVNLVTQYWKNVTRFDKATKVKLVEGTTGNAVGIDAAMKLGRSISGKVSLPNGVASNGFSGYYVWAGNDSGDGAGVAVDAQGNYKIIGLDAGSYQVRFTAPYEANLMRGYYNGVIDPAKATLVDVSGGDKANINHAFTRGATISGKITGVTNPQNSWVGAVSLDGVTYSGSSGVESDGSYRINGLPAGDYRLVLVENVGASEGGTTQKRQLLSAGTTRKWTLAAGGSATVNATALASNQVAATVTGSIAVKGTLPAGSEAVATLFQKFDGAWVMMGFAWLDQSGAYTSASVPAGDYVIRFDELSYSACQGDCQSNPNLKTHEWFDRKATQAAATTITLTTGQKRTGVNGTLTFGVVTPVITAGTPLIEGTPKVGQTLTAAPGTWSPSGVTFAYQWKRAGANISGATSKTYTAVAADAGKQLTVTVTGRLSGATDKSATSAAVTVAATTSWTPPATTRLSGADRFQTAVAISQDGFPNPAAVDTVVLADGYGFADALAAAPLAAKLGGPLLLTQSASLTASTAAEIKRLKPKKVILIGSTSTIQNTVKTSLENKMQFPTVEKVDRIGGKDRFDTSLLIAEYGWSGGVSRAFVATGHNFPDALAGGAAAAGEEIPVVLVWGPSAFLPDGMLPRLKKLGVSSALIAGSTGTVSVGIHSQLAGSSMAVKRYAGTDRVDTSALIAEDFGMKGDSLYLAYGWNFPDALAGAVVAGRADSALVLSQQACMSKRLESVVKGVQPKRVVLLGGEPSLGTGVANYEYCR